MQKEQQCSPKIESSAAAITESHSIFKQYALPLWSLCPLWDKHTSCFLLLCAEYNVFWVYVGWCHGWSTLYEYRVRTRFELCPSPHLPPSTSLYLQPQKKTPSPHLLPPPSQVNNNKINMSTRDKCWKWFLYRCYAIYKPCGVKCNNKRVWSYVKILQ